MQLYLANSNLIQTVESYKSLEVFKTIVVKNTKNPLWLGQRTHN